MIGISSKITTAWQMWPDPLILDYWGELATEKTPDGHNAMIVQNRDNYNRKYLFQVYKSHKYQWEITAKRASGTLALGGGFWGYDGGHNANLTHYGNRFALYKSLDNGWGIYRKEDNPDTDWDKATLFFQLEQTKIDPTKWYVGNIIIRDLTEMGGHDVIITVILLPS